MKDKNMKTKYGLICALSLNLVLVSALNAKTKDEIAADRVDIQSIYNIYNNELVVENNTLMRALNSFADNAKDSLSSFYANERKAKSLSETIDNFDKELSAFSMSYRDIKANYDRQVKKLELLEKAKKIDEKRIAFARDLLKNLDLKDPKDLNQVRSLESSLNNLEARYTNFAQNLATTSISFSLVKPQIEGISTSAKSLEGFFDTAKENLAKSQKSLEEFEPKIDALYKKYQGYLDTAIENYNNVGVLSEDILAKALESFCDIKEADEAYTFDSFKNLRLNHLSKPRDMIKASSNAMVTALESSSLNKRAKSKAESWASPASYADAADGGLATTRTLMSSSPNAMTKTIKELRSVNAIIDDLNDNLSTASAVLNSINNVSLTIKTMGDTSINLLKRALNLSTESQVLLTNMEIFKGELNIKSIQAQIAFDNIKKSLDKIESSKKKIKELL